MTLLVRDSKGQAKYADVREWFSSVLATPEQRTQHSTTLQELLGRRAPEGQRLPRATTVPESFSRKHGPDEALLPLPMRLWQLGAHESSRVKGAPPLRGVRDNLQRFLRGLGCETSKYPRNPMRMAQYGPVFQSRSPCGGRLQCCCQCRAQCKMARHLLCWAAVRLLCLEGDLLDYMSSQIWL